MRTFCPPCRRSSALVRLMLSQNDGLTIAQGLLALRCGAVKRMVRVSALGFVFMRQNLQLTPAPRL